MMTRAKIKRRTRMWFLFIIVCAFIPVSMHAQAQIIAVYPAQNATNVQHGVTLAVTFDRGMEPTTINDTTFMAFGSMSGFHPGVITYNTITHTATLNPSVDFLCGECVAVYCTNAIQDTQGVFFAGFSWNFTIVAADGSGKLKSAKRYAAHVNPRGVAAADLNGDGALDLIVANQGSNDYSVLFGYGNGAFNAPVHTFSGSEPVDVVCGDLDCDNDLDWIIVALGNNAVYGYLNNGAGGGIGTGQFPVGTSPLQAVLADFNGDGCLDCATVNNGTNDMGVLIGNGDGTFQSVTSYAIGPDPRGIHCGDFNEDGWIDIVVTRTGNARIVLFTNDRDGTFTNAGNVTTGNSPYPVLLASLNAADDHLDLISANSGSNNISVALGDGAGGFAGAVHYATPVMPRNLAVCDMNADSALDIIVSAIGNDSLAIMLNDANAQFNTHTSYYGGDSILRVCSGDFSGNGAMDIGVVLFNQDSVAVFLNACDTVPPHIVSTVPDSGETNVAVNSSISITFSEPMDTMTMDTTGFFISGSISPVYTYAIAYDTLLNTAVLDPDSMFAVSETIFVDVSATVADTSGNQMGIPYSFFFITAATSDTAGPVVIAIDVVPDTSQGAHYATASGTVSDSTTGMSVIHAAELFFDSTAQNGTGVPLDPVDGSFDEIIEDVTAYVSIEMLALGDHWIYMHGFDGSLWGTYDSVLLVITPDDDTIGPSFTGFYPDSAPDTSSFHVTCVITDPSGVYDDSTGSGGQGVYLLWDNDGEIVISSQEIQLSLIAGDTFRTDTPIPQQSKDADVVYEVFAYDNDFDYNEPEDRTQGQSGLRSIVIFDARGPVTSQVQVSPPSPPPGISEVVVYANVSDSTTGLSIIAGAEAFLDSVGANGSGFSMQAQDGAYDEIYEPVFDTIPVSGWAASDTHTFYVHGQDEWGSWGRLDSVKVIVSGVNDTIPPEIAFTVPDSGAYDIPQNSWIYVTFSEKVDPLTVTSDKVLIEGDINGVYSFWMSYNELDSTLSINPTGNFALAESINVFIAAGIQDLVGNIMPTGYWWWFRIEGGSSDTLGPDFAVATTPAPAFIGDTFFVSAVPSEPLCPDSAVTCSVSTSDTVFTLLLEPDTAGYSNFFSTIGYSPGDYFLTICGYDLSLNLGITYDTCTISRQGEFLPEAQVYAWPNPAPDNIVNFHYYVNANADVTLDVFTIGGKKIVTLEGRGQGGRPAHQIDSNAIQWDIRNIASDVYVFRLTAVSDVDGETRSVIKKFAIVH
ncbi:Ig-like domain-containing protein [candidate division WOR-3 bacterium]|nr:Ig-like domain-containing protein [candidate division WOR-3 bacterium]